MKLDYKTQGTCSKEINIEMDDNGIIKSVHFVSGCPGNLLGISKIVEGMKATDVIERFKGVRCASKSTSCPDQLATALQQMLDQQKSE